MKIRRETEKEGGNVRFYVGTWIGEAELEKKGQILWQGGEGRKNRKGTIILVPIGKDRNLREARAT